MNELLNILFGRLRGMPISFITRRGNRIEQCPLTVHSTTYRYRGYIEYLSPLTRCFCFIPNCYEMVISFVIGLFSVCGPFAVFRRVWFTVVQSFNCIGLGWFKPHVIEEVLKRFKPSITNHNTSTSIICVTYMIFIITSSFDIVPRNIFLSSSHSVSSCSLGHLFSVKASTALCFSIPYPLTTDSCKGPAITFTLPVYFTVMPVANFDNSESIEFFASNVDKYHKNHLS